MIQNPVQCICAVVARFAFKSGQKKFSNYCRQYFSLLLCCFGPTSLRIGSEEPTTKQTLKEE
jgi:hypothetical protein